MLILPDLPCSWRIIENEAMSPLKSTPVNSSHPSITYRNSVFSIHERQFTRLSFQNFNKRIEPLMIKYGLKQEVNPLEDGEIDPDDDDAAAGDEDDETKTKATQDETEAKFTSTLVKTMRKKFAKKAFPRNPFDNKSRVTKRRRRTRHGKESMTND